MRMRSKAVVWTGTALLVLGSSISQAGEVSFTLGNKSVYAKISGSPSPEKSNFSAGYLYHDGSRHLFDFGAHAQGQTAIGNYPTTTGIGVKGMFFKQHEIEGQALGLGGYAGINIPEVPGLSAFGSLHYAPAITSFAKADGISWLELEGQYRLIQNADVKLGYRHIKSELENSKSITLDSGFYLGINLQF